MAFLFELPFATVLFLLAFYSFSYLPKRIEALYYKEHVTKRRVFSSITAGVVALFVVTFSIFNIYRYGYDNFFSYAIFFFLFFFVVTFGFNLYQVHIKKKEKLFSRKIYYGLENVSEEIENIRIKYPEVNIKKSIANSPVFLTYKSNDKVEFEKLVDQVNTESSIFKDLEQLKYRKKLRLYIGLFSVTIVYLFVLIIWQFLILK